MPIVCKILWQAQISTVEHWEHTSCCSDFGHLNSSRLKEEREFNSCVLFILQRRKAILMKRKEKNMVNVKIHLICDVKTFTANVYHGKSLNL